MDLLRRDAAVVNAIDATNAAVAVHETRLDALDEMPWIYVDQTIGAPLFTNSWVNFDAEPSERNVAFRLMRGYVEMKGLLSGGTVNATMFTLPVGYRPIGNRHFPVIANSLFANLRVGSDGQIQIPSAGSNVFVDLGPVRFDLP